MPTREEFIKGNEKVVKSLRISAGAISDKEIRARLNHHADGMEAVLDFLPCEWDEEED